MSNEIKAADTPDWATAPEWANYVAMDRDGKWYWYEFEPYAETNIWNVNVEHAGKYEMVDLYCNWQESLQKRPENA